MEIIDLLAPQAVLPSLKVHSKKQLLTNCQRVRPNSPVCRSAAFSRR